MLKAITNTLLFLGVFLSMSTTEAKPWQLPTWLGGKGDEVKAAGVGATAQATAAKALEAAKGVGATAQATAAKALEGVKAVGATAQAAAAKAVTPAKGVAK